jgi:hypothetical protein
MLGTLLGMVDDRVVGVPVGPVVLVIVELVDPLRRKSDAGKKGDAPS